MAKFEHGSLTNIIMSAGKDKVVPEVGMGITIMHWTDRRAGTIIEVSKSGKTFKFQEDIAKRIDKNGMSEDQEYEYTRDPKADICTAFLTKDGRWKVRLDGYVVRLNVRDEYYDYSF